MKFLLLLGLLPVVLAGCAAAYPQSYDHDPYRASPDGAYDGDQSFDPHGGYPYGAHTDDPGPPPSLWPYLGLGPEPTVDPYAPPGPGHDPDTAYKMR